MAATGPSIVDLGGSSRSASPESEDIDVDEVDQDYAPQQNSTKTEESNRESITSKTLTSPRSREGPYSRNAPGSAQKVSRASNGDRTAGNAGKRRTRDNRDGAQQQRTTRSGGGMDDFEEFGGLESNFPGTARGPGAAYDRLLDLDYPRDFGDPVARFDAAQRQAASGSAPTAPVISPTVSTSATMQSTSSGDSLPPPVAASEAPPVNTGATNNAEEKMETDA